MSDTCPMVGPASTSKMVDKLREQGRELHRRETTLPGLVDNMLQCLERFWQTIEARTLPSQPQQQGDQRKGKRNWKPEPLKSKVPMAASMKLASDMSEGKATLATTARSRQRYGGKSAPALNSGLPEAFTITGHGGTWHLMESRTIDPRSTPTPKPGKTKPTYWRTSHRRKTPETHRLYRAEALADMDMPSSSHHLHASRT
ncbi:Hypothetical predicted protein [Pelobates cultripes]|uniref:Uncharacterized protein n=1 Tax=Pelobates cultripes TaxID=61616 RepID=A0AAD1TPN9_PELCU|nr:Hypothetical predicted protein [Pelobates cultripes]